MTRACGECTLCCKVLPVPPLKKGAGTKCKHQRMTGCAIYADRPTSCRLWSCRWLTGDDTGDLRRPDRVGYVIDIMPDIIRVQEDDRVVEVVQVWADANRPGAWRDDLAFAAFMIRQAAAGRPTLIRYSATDATLILAPSLTGGEWREHKTNLNPELLKERQARYGY